MSTQVPERIAGRDLPKDFWVRIAANLRVVPSPYRKVAGVLAVRLSEPFEVDTPEGRMSADAGDYLVTDDPPTHAWPVRREVFERTYRYATPDEEPLL